jgi:hypothetical protein
LEIRKPLSIVVFLSIYTERERTTLNKKRKRKGRRVRTFSLLGYCSVMI